MFTQASYAGSFGRGMKVPRTLSITFQVSLYNFLRVEMLLFSAIRSELYVNTALKEVWTWRHWEGLFRIGIFHLGIRFILFTRVWSPNSVTGLFFQTDLSKVEGILKARNPLTGSFPLPLVCTNDETFTLIVEVVQPWALKAVLPLGKMNWKRIFPLLDLYLVEKAMEWWLSSH